MSDAITLVLPLPPKACSPNARGHWAKKARAAKEYRAQAFAEVRKIPAGSRPRFERATVEAVFYFRTAQCRDEDNAVASLKPALDGLADGGLIANDAGFKILPVRFAKDSERPRVELTIRAYTPAQEAA